jgi:hypothetical protein
MNVIVQYVAPLFAYLYLNCLFYVLCHLLCFNQFKFLLSILFLCYYFICFPFYFVCSVIYSFSPYGYCCSLPFVYECKVHCHWVETQLQSVNIVLYCIISSGEIMPNITLWWLEYLIFIFVVRLEGNLCMVYLSLLGPTPG